MDKKKRSKYTKVLLDAYNNGIFKIIWSTSGFTMAVDPKHGDTIPEVKDEEFVEYAFSIIKMVIDLAEGKESTAWDEKDVIVAEKILAQEYDLKSHLYIKKNSNVECFKLMEYDIISHRNENEPTHIEATSAILKMTIESVNEEKAYSFEVSMRDLEDIINKLTELKGKIDMIQTHD